MPIVVNQSPLIATHAVYDFLMDTPMSQPGPTPSAVGPQWCRPGVVRQYPNDFERYGVPRGTYYEKPPGGPVVVTPMGQPVAPTHRLPVGPRGLPTPGGTVVGPGGVVAPGTTQDTVNGVKKRNWWPWLLAAGGAVLATRGG